MKCSKTKTLLFLVILISLSTISLASDFGYNNLELPQLQPEEITTTSTGQANTSNVNSSDYWDDLDTPDDIDWLTYIGTYIWNFFDQSLNTTDDVQFNNINSTGNITTNGLTIMNGEQMTWNDDYYTLNIPTGLGNTIQVGQETTRVRKNLEGKDIYAGQIVYDFGSQGEMTTIKLANAGNGSETYHLGMVTIPVCNNNAVCPITYFGDVNDIDTSKWVEGTALFLTDDGSGNATEVLPTGESYHIKIGTVTRSHASTGIIDFEWGIDHSDEPVFANAKVLQNLNVTGNTTSIDFYIPDMKGNNNFSSLNDAWNIFTSAGRVTGGSIINPSGTSVKVLEGEGVLRIADDDTSQVKFISWDNSSLFNVATDSIMYFGVNYSGGNPTIINFTSETDFDFDTNFPLGSVINQKDELYILNNPWWTGDAITNILERFESEGHIVRDDELGGLTLSYTGTRYVTLTSGQLWSRLNEFPISAFDSSGADTFNYYYRDGAGGFTEISDQSQWNNSHYDDNSGTLQPIGNNQYAVIWVWINVASGKPSLIFPQQYYPNSATAEAEEVPSTFPSMWYKGGVIAGRIIIQEGQDVPVEIQSAFSQVFTSAQATDHGNLAGLGDDDHDTVYYTEAEVDAYILSNVTNANTSMKLYCDAQDVIFNNSVDFSGYVPYSGATSNVDLGVYDLTTDYLYVDTATTGFKKAGQFGTGSTTAGYGYYVLFPSSTSAGYGVKVGAVRNDAGLGKGDFIVQTGGNSQTTRFRIYDDGNAVFTNDLNVSGLYYGNGSQLTGIDTYTPDWNNTDTIFANGNYTGDVNIVGNVTANSFRADAHEQTIDDDEQTINQTGQNSVALTIGGMLSQFEVGSTNPVFSDGTQIGQVMVVRVVVFGDFGFSVITIKDDSANGKVRLNGDKLFNDEEDVLIVMWDGSLWQEVYRNLGFGNTYEGSNAGAGQNNVYSGSDSGGGADNVYSGPQSGGGKSNVYSNSGAGGGNSNVYSGVNSGKGLGNVATAYQAVFGRYSTDQGNVVNWVATDDLFKIGIGASAGSRADAFRLLKNGKIFMETNQPFIQGINGNSSNGSLIQHDGTNQYFNTTGIHYFEQNVSALNLIDRTVFWNKDLGSALEYSYDTKDIINDFQLADFEKSCYDITDFDRPEEEEYIEEIINETGTYNETRTKIIYPHKKEECGRSISATMGRLSEVSNELNEVITIHNRSLVELDDGIITEHIYTQSKVIEDNVSYIEKINDKNKLKNKTSHYSYVENVMGSELDGLDLEERVVVLEGAVNQLFTILCDKNILKKEDGCLK